MTKIKYFNGTEELKAFQCPLERFKAIGGVTNKANWVDHYYRMAGTTADGRVLPVERKIEYKSNPSLHKCNAKCMNGKCNGACECRCGGQNHGINNFVRAA